MPLEFIEISDNDDNIQYPHTGSQVVFFSDSTVTNLVNKSTFFEFMVKSEKYYPKEYTDSGYIRGGEVWLSGDYITQGHYLGSKIIVDSISSVKINLMLESESSGVTNNDVVVLCITEDGNTLSYKKLVPAEESQLISTTITIPETTKFLLVGIHAEISHTPARVMHSFSIIDTASKSVTVESFRDDIRSGKEIVGKSNLLSGQNNDIKIVISDTEPEPIDGVDIIWINLQSGSGSGTSTELEAMRESIENISSDVSSLNSRVTNVSSQINTTNSTVTTLQKSVDSVNDWKSEVLSGSTLVVVGDK